MAKLLNTTFLVTQSAPPTPSSGFGTMYASSSKLFFKNTSGVTYDLTASTSRNINILVYTSSATWSPQPGLQYIKVICAGPGGGGGSGRVGLINNVAGGGNGGAGGNINIAYFSSSALLGNEYNVNITGGGPGGLRVTSNANTNGGTAPTPNSSSFTTGSGGNIIKLLSALGGTGGTGGGLGGGASANIAPTTTQIPNPFPPFYYCGVDGGPGSTLTAINASDAFSGTRWLSAGGGGGGLTNTNTSGSGGSGSAVYSYSTLISSGSPGVVATGVGGSNSIPIFDAAQLLTYSGSAITTNLILTTGGAGGGGGSRAITVNGGNGGSGSLGAGGGGGGGAATNLNVVFSGAGGPGGNGFIIIFEYY
jgi:hypothetical protein